MQNIFDRLEQLVRERIATRLKHLRGQHDQRDHAWNRGMGGGGGARVELGLNQMGPLPTMQMYREQRQQLRQQMRDGVITRTEMQTQLDNLRGIIAKPNRRDDASIVLASKRNVKINPLGQNDFFNVVDEAAPTPTPRPLTIINTSTANQTPKLKPEEINEGVTQFLDKFDELNRQMQDELNAFFDRKPIKWSESEKQDYKDFLIEKNIKEKNQYPTYADAYITESEDSGITQEETIDIQESRPMLSMHSVSIGDLQTKILQKMHHQRAIAVSEMAPEMQDALYEKMLDRIAQIEQEEKRSGQSVDIEDSQLANAAETIMALALYGNPDLRLRAVQHVNSEDEYGNPNGLPMIERKYRNPNDSDPYQLRMPISIVPRKNATANSIPGISDAINYYSLEYRLALALAGKSFDFSGGYVLQDSDTPRESFIKNFTYTHTSETTTNVLGAAIQTAVSRIGPNADAPPAPSLYPPGVTPPEPHPKIIEFLQEQYEETQQEFAAKGVTKKLLYRGTRENVANGIPMSPWSKVSYIAMQFAKGGYFNSAGMLTKYILMYSDQALFKTRYKNEEEYLILETAALEKSDYDILDTYDLLDDNPAHVDWRIKQLNRKRKNGASMFDESNGIVDYLFSSLYEPQYDIFYNYRKKPKAKSTAKELMHRIKKLHNK